MTRHLVNPNLRQVGSASADQPGGAELWRTYVADMDRQIEMMFKDGGDKRPVPVRPAPQAPTIAA